MIALLMNLEIYWDNLFTYLFWLAYGGLVFVLWRYDYEIWNWYLGKAKRFDDDS